MPTTPTWLLPYPTLSDTPDVPRDVQALADAVDDALDTVYAPRPMTLVRRTTSLSMPAQTAVDVPWTVEAIDELGIFNLAAPTELRIVTAGWYRVEFSIVVDAASGVVLGQMTNEVAESGSAGSGIGFAGSASLPQQLTANQVLRLSTISTAGATLGYAMAAVTRIR